MHLCYLQFSLDLNGPERTLTLRLSSVGSDAPSASYVFDGEGVAALLDMRWHKVALSLQRSAASLHVDCSSIETKPLEPWGHVSASGHTLMFMRATDAAPVEVRSLLMMFSNAPVSSFTGSVHIVCKMMGRFKRRIKSTLLHFFLTLYPNVFISFL